MSPPGAEMQIEILGSDLTPAVTADAAITVVTVDAPPTGDDSQPTGMPSLDDIQLALDVGENPAAVGTDVD